jgi:hypothetical protein
MPPEERLQWGPGLLSRETSMRRLLARTASGFNGARDSCPGKRCRPGPPGGSWPAGFNGARDCCPGKPPRRPRSATSSSGCFNGARDSCPGKRGDRGHHALLEARFNGARDSCPGKRRSAARRAGRRTCFNGARDSCPGKRPMAFYGGDYVTLQWGPGFLSRETRHTRFSSCRHCCRFNGARDSCPGKLPKKKEVAWRGLRKLQWGPGFLSRETWLRRATWSGSSRFNGARDSCPGKPTRDDSNASTRAASMGPGILVPGNSPPLSPLLMRLRGHRCERGRNEGRKGGWTFRSSDRQRPRSCQGAGKTPPASGAGEYSEYLTTRTAQTIVAWPES